MEFRASHRHAKISPTKAQPVADLIRGQHVNDALEALRATPNRGAQLIDKVLRSAMANADQDPQTDMENLRVKGIWVDQGPTRAGWRPRARGRVERRKRRSSHITVVVDDGQ